jgi:biotin carboxylase
LKKRVLVLCGNERDERELSVPYFSKWYDIIFEQSSKQWLSDFCQSSRNDPDVVNLINTRIDDIIDFCKSNAIDGVVSTCDYPANILRVAVTERLGLPGPSLQSVLMLEHKYSSRILQKSCVPEAVMPFFLIEHVNQNLENFPLLFPIILKPVKSSFSRNVRIIHSYETFQLLLQTTFLPKSFLTPFNYLLRTNNSCVYDACALIAESLVQGYQTTVDGFVYEGDVTILGVVDSIMFPGTISFERFDYPSLLQEDVQDRMMHLVTRVMKCSGLNNSLFNVECMYNPETDQIYIIEINPRMSSQFADLYERVDGFNTYEILLDLSVGKKTEIKKRQGKFAVASSYVLRRFSDCYVEKIPSLGSIKTLYKLFPDIRVELYARPGVKLSEYEQDSNSFRYGLIHLGGYDRDDLKNRYDICQQLLEFKFRDKEVVMKKLLGIILFFFQLFSVNLSFSNLMLIESVQINRNIIDIVVNKEFKKQYLNDDFFAEYPDEVNLESLDYSIVTIPFIMQVISIIWISGKMYYIDSMDETLYYSLKRIRKIIKLLYLNTSWKGKLIPKRLVKNTLPLSEDTNKIAITFTSGLDSVCTSMRHRDKEQLLIHIDRTGNTRQVCKFAQQFGHELIFMRSNFIHILNYSVLNKLSPEIDFWWTGAIEGLGYAGMVSPILITKGYSVLLLPASNSWDCPFVHFANPIIDNNICFANVKIQHDSFDLSRVQKQEYLANLCAQEKIAPPELLVCSTKNCCRCEKCLRTINGFLALGEPYQDYGFDISEEKVIPLLKELLRGQLQRRFLIWHNLCIQQKVKERQQHGERLSSYLQWFLSLNLEDMLKRDKLSSKTIHWRNLFELSKRMFNEQSECA